MSSRSHSKSTETQTGNSPSAWRRREKDRRAGFIGLSILVHGMMATLILFYGQRILQLGGGGQEGSGIEEFGQSGVAAGIAGSGSDLNTSALEVVQIADPSQTTQMTSNSAAEPATSPSDVVLPQSKESSASMPENKVDSTPQAPKETVTSTKKASPSKLISPIRNVEARPMESETPVEEPPRLMANPPDVTGPDVTEPDVTEPEVAETEVSEPITSTEDPAEVATKVESNKSSVSEPDEQQLEPASALVATEVVEQAPAKTESQDKSEPVATESVPTEEAEREAPKAMITKSMLSEEASNSQATTQESVNESGAIAGASSSEQSKAASTNESGGTGGQGGGDSRGLKGPITGAVGVEIRDASELAALPGNPKPSYPAQDRLRKYEGKAVLVGRVGADGRMSQVLVERSSGSSAMDASAIEAFKRWRYRPGQQSWVRQPFQFRLIGEATEIPARLGQNSSHR